MNKKKWLLHGVCLSLLLTFCIFRFQEAVFQKVLSANYSPDGYGSVGGLQMMIDQAKEMPSHLLGDVFQNFKLGLGVLEPGPFSFFWKIYVYTFGLFTDALQIVLLSVFVIAVLNGVVFYFSAFHFTKNHFLSLLGAVFAISFYNYHLRSNGHLFGLGSIFMPILLIAYLVHISQTRNAWSYFWLGLLNAANFSVNEYYGFFGAWVSAIVLAFVVLREVLSDRTKIYQTVKQLGIAGIVFGTAMLLLYPNLIAKKIAGFLLQLDQGYVKGIGFATNEIVAYSIQNFTNIFVVNRHFARPYQESFYSNSPEFTFSIGFFVTIFVAVNLFLLKKRLDYKEKSAFYVLGLVTLTSFLLCLDPQYYPSLVSINAKIAPMFRVVQRSLIYFNIAVTLAFIYSFWLLFKKTDSLKSKIGRYLVLSLIVVTIDLPYPHLFAKIGTQSYPSASELLALRSEKSNYKIINLPMFLASELVAEKSYLYAFEYYYHRKEIINFPFTHGNNSKFLKKGDEFSKYVNEFSPDVPQVLAELGVQYIVYHKQYYGNTATPKQIESDLQKISTTAGLKQILNSSERAVFEISDLTAKFNTQNLVMDILTPKNMYFDFSSGCKKLQDGRDECSSRAMARFVNYYRQKKHVTADFVIELAGRQVSKRIDFEVMPLKKYEFAFRDLINEKFDSLKVVSVSTGIEDVK